MTKPLARPDKPRLPYRGGPHGISHETRRTLGATACLAMTATPCARPTVKGEPYCLTHSSN